MPVRFLERKLFFKLFLPRRVFGKRQPFQGTALGLDLDQVDALVATNWVRTLAWTARGLLLGAWLWRELERGSGLELVE